MEYVTDKMKFSTFLIIIFFKHVSGLSENGPKLYCNWMMTEKHVNLSLCDHLIVNDILASELINPNTNFEQIFDHSTIESLLKVNAEYAQTPKSISVFGDKMVGEISTPTLKPIFIKKVIEVTRKLNFTGIHLAFPLHPKDISLNAYFHLLKDLAEEIKFEAKKSNKPILSLCIEGSCHSSFSEDYSTLSRVFKYVDTILLPPSSLEHNQSPLIPFEKCTIMWASFGAKSDVIYPGVPFYGRIFDVNNTDAHSALVPYNEICQLLEADNWNDMVSIGHSNNVASNGSHWIQYENAQSLRNKALSAVASGLGGVSVWSVSFDDNDGKCGDPNLLMKTLSSTMKIGPKINKMASKNHSTLTKTLGDEYCSPACVHDSDKKDDCTKFTRCTYVPETQIFLKKEFKCTPGFLFDADKGVCVNGTTKTGRNSYRTGRQYQSKQIPQCSAPGRFRIASDCRSYQICQPSAVDATVFVSEVEHCLTGLVFSDTTKSCLLPSQVPECSGGTGSTQVAQCKAVGYFRIASNCSRYLICYPDAYNEHVFIPDLGECPEGLFFSQNARACVLPAQVPECNRTINNSTQAPLPVCTASGNFRLGTECGRYISCIADANNPGSFITQIANCPTGRVYSSSAGTCLPPAQVPTCSTFYPRCVGAGNFRLGLECPRYLSCIPDPNNPGTFIAQIARCPLTLSFSPASRACMPTAGVPECALKRRNDILGPDIEIGKELACSSPGTFNIGNRCDHYLKCIRSVGGSLIAKIEVCVNNTVFDIKKGSCVPKSGVSQCKNGVDGSLAKLFGRQSLICTGAGSFRLGTTACSRQYLQCTRNPLRPGTFTTQILSCPTGMAFSQTTSSCLPSTRVPGCGAPTIDTSLAIPTCPAVGNFRLGLECSRYLSCVADPSAANQFITQLVNCPSNQAFNAATGLCQDPNTVPECMALSIPSCNAAGNFKIGSDCSRYLSCIPDPNNPGTSIIQISNCPSKLAFDFQTGTCLPAGQVKHCPVIVPTVVPTTVNTTFTPRCTSAGFFRIPTDCTKYLSCFPSPVNGTIFVPQILDCPPGLYFSEAQGICQLPGDVPACAQSLPVSCTAAGLFSIPSDCSKYLECSPDPNGNPHVFIPEVKYCLSGLYFSPVRKTCLQPVDVPQCSTDSSANTGTTCTKIGLFRIPSDCSKYLRCNPNPDLTAGVTFIPEVVYCYPGLVFSDKQKACLRLKQVPECKTNGHGSSSNLPIQGCTEAGFFPITGDCSTYLSCNPNPLHTSSQIFTPTLEKCPSGLFFSPSRRFCYRANEVPECRSYLSTGFPNNNIDEYQEPFRQNFGGHRNSHYFARENLETSASSQTQTFANGQVGLCIREGYKPVPGDCTKYVVCMPEPSSGLLVALIKHCPLGQLFSRQSNQCLPQNDVQDCNDNFRCTNPGLFPLPGDCQKYAVCERYNGLFGSYIEKCPNGKSFSREQNSCLPTEHVEGCRQNFSHCPMIGVFSVEDDCTQYMACLPDFDNPLQRKVKIAKCPQNYAFSAEKQKCLPIQQVSECSLTPNFSPKCFRLGKFPHPNSCSSYIVCKRDPNNIYGLVSTIETCPSRTVFNEANQACVSDTTGICGKNKQIPDYQQSSSSVVECKDQYPIRDNNDCSRFYFCSLRTDGAFEAFAFTCPPGYYFDDAPNMRMCMTASHLPACFPRPNEPTAILANSKVCSKPGVTRKPNDCSHFYHCLIENNRLKQIEFACPQDYMFSEKFSTCTSTGNEVPACREDNHSVAEVPFTCLKEGLFPKPDDCRQYFRCRYNKVQDVFNLSIGQCPKTVNGQQLLFIEETEQCDWPTLRGNPSCKIV